MFTCMLDFISMFAVQFELQVQFELLLKAHGQCEERCHHVCHVSKCSPHQLLSGCLEIDENRRLHWRV